MILDILVAVILIASMIYGYRKGFVFTLIHTVGWVGALVIAYMLTPWGTSFAKENTGLYTWMEGIVRSKFDVTLDAIDVASNSLPAGISPNIETGATNIVDSVTEEFTNIFGTVLVFVILFVLIKIVLWLLLRLLSKDYRDGFVNHIDGFLGLIFGIVRGLVVVLLLFALLLPASNLLSTDLTEWINTQLESSFLAETLYDENLLLLLIENYLH